MNDLNPNQNRRGLPGSKLPSFVPPKEGNRRKSDPGLPPPSGVPSVRRTGDEIQNLKPKTSEEGKSPPRSNQKARAAHTISSAFQSPVRRRVAQGGQGVSARTV